MRSAKAARHSRPTLKWSTRCAPAWLRASGWWSRARAAARWTRWSRRCWPTTPAGAMQARATKGTTMLLELARWLEQLQSSFALFGYLTFRGILSALTAVALSLWWGPAVIRKLASYKGGQPIRTDGPQTHFSKAGTPTMGGALILVTVLASVLLWGDLRNKYVWLVLAVMVAFGAIGWWDDWIKIVRRDPNGRKSRTKYALQSLFGLAAGLFLYMTAEVPAETTFYIPFFKAVALPLVAFSFVA